MASDGETSCANDPNFAVIYSFLKVFGKLYGLEVPSISKLQEQIENNEEVLDPLRELHLKLLRRALKTVHSNRWERGLIKFCHQQGAHQEAWEIERFSYKKASTQVKLKVLKVLLEYQFTCHQKFKSAVNAITCKELRLDPVGRDKNGCVYWLQVDHEANLFLYKEDQDEETWQLVARSREELVKVIDQLKKGEEVGVKQNIANTNEDSNSGDVTQKEIEPKKTETEEENEEFLSPESESEHEGAVPDAKKDEDSHEKDEQLSEESKTEVINDTDKEQKVKKDIPDESSNSSKDEHKENVDTPVKTSEVIKSSEEDANLNITDDEESLYEDSVCTENIDEMPVKESSVEKEISSLEKLGLSAEKKEEKEDVIEDKEPQKCSDNLEKIENENDKSEDPIDNNKGNVTDSQIEQPSNSEVSNKEELEATDADKELDKNNESNDTKVKVETEKEATVGEAIEEPVMVVTGEGNGVDCESSYIIGEEITEEVLFFYGVGDGYDNDTGNPDVEEQEKANSDTEDCMNGEHKDIPIPNDKVKKGVKLRRNNASAVTKRTLKKQSNDSPEAIKPDSKKPCVREKSQSSREGSVNDKSTTDSESPNKNNVKKIRNKLKKKPEVAKKLKLKKDIIKSVPETDNGHDSKSSIIEKRKSSLSSDHEETENAETEKEKTPEKDVKIEDSLPPKKIRLEKTPDKETTVSHSKEPVDTIDVNNTERDENKGNSTEDAEAEPVSKRKKIKAKKGKFKRKKLKSTNNSDEDKHDNVDKVASNGDGKNMNKSLKRPIIDDNNSDKSKSESQSESEDEEPATGGKRLKIKPKKIITSSRKKVEAKLQKKDSSSESEEETLYSLAGKKTAKKVVKKKPKGKDKSKAKTKSDSDGSEVAPVRQSRRIAQLKIKEEAERRHMEEVALRELKMIHKKKNNDDEEEDWKASGASSSEPERKFRKKPDKWKASDSTGPEPDSDSDEHIFEHEEPDLEFGKSDHEFSPESDLETDEPVEPIKRARTLQEEAKDEVCAKCGSGEQPEWILLCDSCDAGYHASCLTPVLFLVPHGAWYCPPCHHKMLITALEEELVKYDELVVEFEAEKARKRAEEPEEQSEEEVKEKERERTRERKSSGDDNSDDSESGWSSESSGAVYRLRTRRQLPVSYRSMEYDKIMSTAIKEEYVEPTTSAGNQGRGKDISTIIEAAEEEKMKAEREAIQQGMPVEKKSKKKQRRKPRKLNSLDVPSEDDNETDEDFKDTGMESSSEEISSSGSAGSAGSRGSRSSASSDVPIQRLARHAAKHRPKLRESSPEVKKKKKGVFADSSSESSGTKEWPKKNKSSCRPSGGPGRRRRGLTQYDALGNAIRARVTYGGLSADEDYDWIPKHRTRQKKINYTEMPNTESEDEMHKSSGKHMLESSDEFKLEDSEVDTDDSAPKPDQVTASDEERRKAISDLVTKTAVVPITKLPDDVTKVKTEGTDTTINCQQEVTPSRPLRGKGSRGGRGSRGPRGRGASRGGARGGDDALAKLVGVKIKDLSQDSAQMTPNQAEREKKRQEREAKLAEKEAKRAERLKKKEEKEKLKEQKAKEREEKRQAKIAMQESKRIKKEEFKMSGPPPGYGPRVQGPDVRMNMYAGPPGAMRHPGPHDFAEQRFSPAPRLQVRAELRGSPGPHHRPEHPPNPMREGTLSVAGSPQPFKPVSEEPSIITRMPHIMNQQYRGHMLYPGRFPGPYPPRGAYPPHYYPHAGPYHAGPSHQGPPHQAPGPPHPGGPHQAPGPLHPGAPYQAPGPPHPGAPHQAPGPPHPGAPHQAPGPPHAGAQHPGPPLQAPRPPHPSGPMPDPVQPDIKIKAEVKAEPEYQSPSNSPRPPSPKDEAPRHPKIKVTESKDRRPRFPLGPYAPQYGSYGPYAPGPGPGLRMHQYLPHDDKGLDQRFPRPSGDRIPSHLERLAQFERAQNLDRNPHMDRMPGTGPSGMERPPGHMDRPSGHMDRHPGHMDRPPGHMDRPPGHMDRPPGHVDRPPGHMDRPPGHMDRPPGHMDRPPGHMDRPPGMDRIPGHMERPPGHMDRPPGHMDRPPGHMDRPPGHMDRPPGHMDRPPGHMDRPPGHMDRPPGHMDRPPGHMDRPSGHMDRFPVQMDRHPGMDRPPGHMERIGPIPMDRNPPGPIPMDRHPGMERLPGAIPMDRHPGMERPQGPMDRPPTGPVPLDRHPGMERPPGHMDRPPGQVDRPSGIDRPPGHMERPPGYMERPPSMDRPPGHIDRLPGHMDRPHGMERAPGHMVRPPGMERIPIHMERQLGMDRHPIHMERPLGMNRPPGLEGPPGHLERPHNHMDGPPGHMERSPGYMVRPHGHMERPPGLMDMAPGHLNHRPPNMDIRPHLDNRPTLLDQRPPSMERPGPPFIEQRPPSIDKLSPHLEQRPPSMERPSPHLEHRPQNLERPAPTLDSRPPSMERPSPQLEQRPPSLERPGSHVEQRPPSIERPGPHLEQRPPSIERPGPHLEQRPPSTERPISHSEQKPPSDGRPSPSISESSKEKSPSNPEEPVDKLPTNIEQPSPQERTVTPERSEALERPPYSERISAQLVRPNVVDRTLVIGEPPNHLGPPHIQFDRHFPHLPPPVRGYRPPLHYAPPYHDLHRPLEKLTVPPPSTLPPIPRQEIIQKTLSPIADDKTIEPVQNLTMIREPLEPRVSTPEATKTSIKTEGDEVNVKLEKFDPPQEGSVFGGLVSYFSSQQEDEIDP